MTHGMSIEDKLDNWAKHSTAGQKAVLHEASASIRGLKAQLNYAARLMSGYSGMIPEEVLAYLQNNTQEQKAEDNVHK